MIPRLKTGLVFISLLYVTVYAPVMTVAYFPFSYRLGCVIHGRCAAIGEDNARTGIGELTAFMRHGADHLPSPLWTAKEKKHLAEVRGMIDVLTLLAVPALAIPFVFFNRSRIRRLCLVNLAAVLSPLCVLPFFKYFWRYVFHPLLFDNRLWMNTPLDFSYYILPRVFFQYTVAYVAVSAFLINAAVYALLTVTGRVLPERAPSQPSQ